MASSSLTLYSLLDTRAILPDPRVPSASSGAAYADAVSIDDLEPFLTKLDADERRLVILRFGLDRVEPRTLEEVGEELGLTREEVRRREEEAMKKLRQ